MSISIDQQRCATMHRKSGERSRAQHSDNQTRLLTPDTTSFDYGSRNARKEEFDTFIHAMFVHALRIRF
jgi:hypothetical protein